MPTDAGKEIDQLARLGQPHRPVLRRIPRKPPNRGAVIPLWVVVADQQDKTERVRQVDTAELSRSRQRQMRVPGLESSLELGVSVALGGHGEHMFAHRRSMRWLREPVGSPWTSRPSFEPSTDRSNALSECAYGVKRVPAAEKSQAE
jgi:hypothetical protein